MSAKIPGWPQGCFCARTPGNDRFLALEIGYGNEGQGASVQQSIPYIRQRPKAAAHSGIEIILQGQPSDQV